MIRIVPPSNGAATPVGGLLTVSLILALGFLTACGKPGDEGGAAPESVAPQAGAAAQIQPAESDEEQDFANLVRQFESGDFGGAIRNAGDFAARYPESAHLAQVLYLSGRASISRGDFDDAMATFARMREGFPDDANIPFADLYNAQALYLKVHAPVTEYKLDREEAMPGYEKALAAFREVASRHQGDAEVATRARLMAGQVLFEMRKREEALEIFQGYLKAEPAGKYADQALFQAGDILMQLGRYDEAREAFTRLTSEFPGTPNSGSAIDRIREIAIVGEPMPSLQGPRWLGGGPSPDYQGKVVLLVFWGTWCSHCQHEMPKLEAVYRKLKDRGFVVLGLTNNSQKQNDAAVNAFIAEHELTFPIGIEQGRASDAYAVGRIPAAAIIDRKGIVRWRNSGDLVTEELIEKYL